MFPALAILFFTSLVKIQNLIFSKKGLLCLSVSENENLRQ